MYYLREYNATGNPENYKESKAKLEQLSTAINETDLIIQYSPELHPLENRLLAVATMVGELGKFIDETAQLQNKLKSSQHNLKVISANYSEDTKSIILLTENNLRKELSQKNINQRVAKDLQRKNQLIHRVVDKANENMISAFEAISFNNPEYLKPTMKEFRIIFHLVSVLDTIHKGTPENAQIKLINSQLHKFQNEVILLENNQKRYWELAEKQTEISSLVLNEAAIIGEEGMMLAGDVLEDRYENIDRLIQIFNIGLIISFAIAILFSILITRSITIPIAKSVKFAEEIASGNLDATVKIDRRDEVGILASALKNMGVKLKENIDNLRRVKLEMLSVSLQTEEKERKRFAEDLHDGLGPLLSTIKLFVSALKDKSLHDDKREYLINNTEQILKEAISTTRNISYNLLPNQLNDFGLDVAIKSFCERVSVASGINIMYNSSDYPTNLDRHTETMLFRIVSELINNTIKHAGATDIEIKMYFDDNQLHIDYFDNGKGFDLMANFDKKRQGLANLVNRAKYINGNIDFITSPGNGLKVLIWIEKGNLFLRNLELQNIDNVL
jgi:signal transduction histidine kinase